MAPLASLHSFCGSFSSLHGFSGPTARLHSLVGCNSDKVGSLDGGKARKIGRGPAVAPASWSAGSPLPLWQCAWQRLASILIATPSVGEMRKALMVNGIFRGQGTVRLAKAAEDCPHSKTLARLSETPLGSITTVMRKLLCYRLPGQRPDVCTHFRKTRGCGTLGSARVSRAGVGVSPARTFRPLQLSIKNYQLSIP